MAETPERAEPGRSPARALLPRGDKRRDGRDVIGIGRVPQSEERRDEDHDPDGGAAGEVRDCVVEPEHGVYSPAFPIRFR